MKEYPNAYADLAYTLCFSPLFSDLNDLLQNAGIEDRLLYATDFFLTENKETACHYNENIVNRLNQASFLQIAHINPKAFLSSKYHTP